MPAQQEKAQEEALGIRCHHEPANQTAGRNHQPALRKTQVDNGYHDCWRGREVLAGPHSHSRGTQGDTDTQKTAGQFPI